MPKKKKKDKSGGAAEEEPSQTSETSGQPGAGAEGVPGPAGNLLAGGPASLLNKAPSGSSQLPPLLKSSTMFKDKDPNMKLLGNSEMAEMEQWALNAHNETPGNIGGSMNVFAINKDGISRAVVKFIDKPQPQPLTICFHFPGTFLTHRYVVAIIKGAVASVEGADVTAVQYCDRNVRLGTRGLENRWMVTVNDMKAKQLLLMKGIKVVNRTIYVKSYDEVIGEEYREYQRWYDLQNRMKMGYGAKNKNKPEVATTGSSGATSAATTETGDKGGDSGGESENGD